ncbi:MAG: biopolymer transporter ExbD [Verrucomicrobiota bacterium]
MRVHLPEHDEMDFPMAPMIDMVFLLLVFFMCAGTLAQASKSQEVELPESSQSQVPEQPGERITLTLYPDGSLFLGLAELPLEELPVRLSVLDQDTPVLIRADRTTPYRELEPLMQLCRDEGFSQLHFATFQVERALP